MSIPDFVWSYLQSFITNHILRFYGLRSTTTFTLLESEDCRTRPPVPVCSVGFFLRINQKLLARRKELSACTECKDRRFASWAVEKLDFLFVLFYISVLYCPSESEGAGFEFRRGFLRWPWVMWISPWSSNAFKAFEMASLERPERCMSIE